MNIELDAANSIPPGAAADSLEASAYPDQPTPIAPPPSPERGPLEKVLQALRDAGADPVETGCGWQCRCPAHDDKKKSLSIAESADGKVLIKCHAGCAPKAVVEKIGVRMRDLFPTQSTEDTPTIYPYRDVAGSIIFEKVRFRPKRFVQRRPDGEGGYVYNLKPGWYRRKGSGWELIHSATDSNKQPEEGAKWFGKVPHVLYRQSEIIEAVRMSRPILYPEGEKDVTNLVGIGLDATTNSGGAGEAWCDEYGEALKGAIIIFIPDQDEAGNELFMRYAPHLKEVAKELRRLDLPPGFKDVSDWLAAGHTREDLDALIAAAPVWSGEPQPEPWPDLNTQPKYEALPEFPIGAMPSALRDMVLEIFKSDQVAPEVAALAVCAAIGLAAGGRYRTSIKDGVGARPNLYILIFAGIGERKSTIYGRVLGPVEDWIREHLPAWQQVVDQVAIHEERIAALHKRLADIDATPEEIQATQQQIIAESAHAPDVRSPLILSDDSTIEAMVYQMDKTGGQLGVFSDDARQFLQILTGRYSDGKSQEGVFLKAYDGTTPIRSDRRSRQPIIIDNPCIACFLMVQLDWLAKLGHVQDLAHSGFLSRNLFCVPDPIAGTKDANGNLRRAFSDYQIDPTVFARYREIIQRLLNESYVMTEIRDVPIDADARSLWVEYYNGVEGEIGPKGALCHIADIAKRYPTQALRLALIATLCRGGASVSIDDMMSGIQLISYFAHHAERALQAMKSQALPIGPERIVKFIRRQRLSEFSVADLERRLGGMDPVEMESAVLWLAEHGYCRSLPVAHEGPGRKPSPRFKVNPNLFSQGGQS